MYVQFFDQTPLLLFSCKKFFDKVDRMKLFA